MTDDEVAALYRHPSVRALVALTRGEGFGLPTLEAAASGLPVITTGWSGHLDFLKAGKFVSVAYTLNEVNKKRIDGSIFVAGARWADVVEEDAKRRIMKFRTSPDVPMEWARDLQKKLLVSHSQEAINSIYEKEIGDLL
jgi:glycosyltransferase involved in cell wall biosynthesis